VVREVEDISLWSVVSGSSSLNAKDVAVPTSQNKKLIFTWSILFKEKQGAGN